MPCRQGVTNLISNELQGQWKDVLYAGCLWEGLFSPGIAQGSSAKRVYTIVCEACATVLLKFQAGSLVRGEAFALVAAAAALSRRSCSSILGTFVIKVSSRIRRSSSTDE